MSPKNTDSRRRLADEPLRRLVRLGSIALPLLCSMGDPRATQGRSNAQVDERNRTSSWEAREAPLAAAQRIFDSTVRLRLHALFAPSALEVGQRACGAAIAKEPVRGRLDRALVLVANEQLTLPMGAGSVVSVAGQSYLFCLEPHYHPPGGGIAPEGWHKGVTVYHAQAPKESSMRADPS
jgi:hypothetical protein